MIIRNSPGILFNLTKIEKLAKKMKQKESKKLRLEKIKNRNSK
tara:strand:+ start:390 stop:518 length:129 start_codon:yes stop_codon:yes gene_type:complete